MSRGHDVVTSAFVGVVLCASSFVLVGGCRSSAFSCSDASECTQQGVQGRCEPAGWCSFPDPSCESGFRYGESSGGGVAGSCTPVDPEFATSGATTSPTSQGESTALSSEGSGFSETTAGDASSTSSSSSDATTSPSSSGGASDTDVPSSCPESLDACDAWFLPNRGTQWEPVMIGGPAALRPRGPVVAAFDIEALRRGFVLTATDVSTFDLETRAWLDRRFVSDVFPEVVGEEVLAATAIPASWGEPDQEKVRLTAADVVYLYWHDEGSGNFALQSVQMISPSDPNAPDPAIVQARWFDTTNGPGWVQGSLEKLCGAMGPATVYAASVATGSLYVRDLGLCGTYFPVEAYSAVLPTSYPLAPEPDAVRGAIYNETTGLVLLAE